ncbi:AP2-LIKE ETHYLENE-RESPONSIVE TRANSCRIPTION FACTOR [Salix viminalis]|uniref:AP2-LIKE ETHYLENE-RESPONSIVE TRANSCRIPTION FACTOR n=1 Tax=Salix viminalis TaxID=40686 RepID=A0A9Q0V648_SALVM|nr:AP2-LIKE ETHYLENE-RESPONSIVE TRANSCRIPTION FACTOR [Salix viminalis]
MASDLGLSTQPIYFSQIPNHAREVGAMAQMTRDQGVANFNKHEGTSKWRAWTPSGEHMLNIFETEEEAAIAFDLACIKQKGYQATTNYDIRYYNVQAMINNGRKPKLPQMEAETPCPVTAAPVQVYRHRINTGGAGYSTTMQPTIYRARGFRPAKGLPHFAAILGLVKQDNGTGSRFKHGEFSPFNFYQRQQVRKPAARNKYPNSVNFESEQMLSTAGRLGFKHSCTSRFKVYRRNTMWKGKAKVSF